MRSYLNTVNSFEVNSLGVNSGTMRPGGLTSEQPTSLYVLGEDYSFNTDVSFYTGSVTGINSGSSIEESVSVSTPVKIIWGPHNNLDTSAEFTLWADIKYGASSNIEPVVSVEPHTNVIWSPQDGSIKMEPVARFYSDMDNIFGSIFPFLNESIEYGTKANVIWGPSHNIEPNASIEPHANMIYSPSDISFDEDVSVKFWGSMVYGPSHDLQPNAEVSVPVYRLMWRAVDVDEYVSILCPIVRRINGSTDIEEDVAVWLKDWSDADEKVACTKIQSYTGMLVDLWVKMYFYPINNTSGMDACVTVRRPIYVESIDNVSEVITSSFIKKWVQYIGNEAELFSAPVVGVTSQVGIDNTVIADFSGCLIMNNNGAVIANNGDEDKNRESVSIGGDVYVNGYLKLQLHTKDCPVYP